MRPIAFGGNLDLPGTLYGGGSQQPACFSQVVLETNLRRQQLETIAKAMPPAPTKGL